MSLSKWKIVLGLALIIPAVAYAANQLSYPVDEITNQGFVPAYKFTQQGSRTAMWLIGQQNNSDATLKVEATANGTAGEFISTTIVDFPALKATANCVGSNPCAGIVGVTNWGEGVKGEGSRYGLEGKGNLAGVHGLNKLTNDGDGVFGEHTAANGSGAGVRGTSQAGNGGIFQSNGSNNNNFGFDGVRGISAFGNGVRGFGTQLNGVRGDSFTTGASGVYGENLTGGGFGVAGRTNQGGNAVFGDTGHLSNGNAGLFTGKVQVLGNLSKGGGSFKIDHPLDPTNKYLYHSFVESPDMMNVYNGIVTLDASGSATVQMPAWFSALNRDFRYQLTSIGKFSPVYVSSEMANNHFSIGGGSAGQRISWQVTGIRQDKYANSNRIPVEENKSPEEVGKYLHPTAFGRSQSEGIVVGPKSSP